MTKAKPSYEDLALNALGFSDDEDAAWLTAHLAKTPGDLNAARRVEEGLGALTVLAGDAVPSDDLFTSIEAQLDSEAPEGARTVHSDSGKWFERSSGVWCKILNEGADGGSTRLLRCEAGSIIPGHRHDHDEELFVLEGEIQFGALRLSTGDFHLAKASSLHVDATTAKGCLILVRG